MSDEARMALPLARDAFRLIRRNPVLSLVVVGSLAIGITINATAFSLIDGFVLRPLPIADPARLVGIRTVSPTGGTGGVSRDDFLDIQNGTRTLSAVAAYETAGAVVGNVGDTPEVVTLGVVTTNYFSLLGVDAVRGRLFGEIDRDVSQGAPGAVISYRYWQQKFSGDPSVIGRGIRLNAQPWTIIGVLPERFAGTLPLVPPAIWISVEGSVANGRTTGSRGEQRYAMFGRLARRDDRAGQRGNAGHWRGSGQAIRRDQPRPAACRRL